MEDLLAYMEWADPNVTIEETALNMSTAADNFEKMDAEFRFLLVDKETKRFLGVIGLMPRKPTVPSYEVGYWLRSTATGRGYMGEALMAVEKFAFEQLKAERVEVRMAECNTPSKAIAVRAGYALEGLLRNDRRLPSGKLSSTYVYSKVSDEYERQLR